MPTNTRRRIADSELHAYEDDIARMVDTITQVQRLTGLLDVPTLEEVSPILAAIIRNAGRTRHSLIERMNSAKDNG